MLGAVRRWLRGRSLDFKGKEQPFLYGYLGYDVFVSFTRRDPGSRNYACSLADALRQRGYDVFFDEDAILPGNPLWEGIEAALARTKILLVVASPAIFQVEAVASELKYYLKRRPKGVVLPINIKRTLEVAPSSHWLLQRLWINEYDDDFNAGAPSTAVLDTIIRTSRGLWRGWLRRRVLQVGVTILVCALVAVVYFAAKAIQQERQRMAAEIVARTSTGSPPYAMLASAVLAHATAPQLATALIQDSLARLPRHTWSSREPLAAGALGIPEPKRFRRGLLFAKNGLELLVQQANGGWTRYELGKSVLRGTDVPQLQENAAVSVERTAAATSPNRRFRAIPTEDGVRFLDLVEHTIADRPWLHRPAAVKTSGLSDDGQLYGVLGNDGRLRVLTRDGQELNRPCDLLPPKAEDVGFLRISSKGEWVAVDYRHVCTDNPKDTCRTVRVVDFSCRAIHDNITGRDADIRETALFNSPFNDNPLLAIGLRTGIQVLNLRTRSLQSLSTGRTSDLLAFSPDGRFLAVAGVEGDVFIHDATDLRELATVRGYGWNEALAFDPSGGTLATAGYLEDTAALDLWHFDAAGNVSRFRQADPSFGGAVAWHSERPVVATGFENTIALVDSETGKRVSILPPPPAECLVGTTAPQAIAFTGDNRVRALFGRGHSVEWNLGSGFATCIGRQPATEPTGLLSRDGRVQAGISAYTNILGASDLDRGTNVCQQRTVTRRTKAALAESGDFLAWSDVNGTEKDGDSQLNVAVQDLQWCWEANFTVTLPPFQGARLPGPLAIDASGRRLAVTIGEESQGRLLLLQRSRLVPLPLSATLNAWSHEADLVWRQAIEALTFSPDGHLLAVRTHGAIDIVDVDTGRTVYSLSLRSAYGDGIDDATMAFSADGQRIAVSVSKEAPLFSISGDAEILLEACRRIPRERRTANLCPPDSSNP